MKKPNITEGEWSVHLGPIMPDGKHIAYLGDRLEIRSNEGVDNHRANAKAISAVPEMIDALAMVWQELESKEDWGEDLSPSQIHQIHKALKKAGVEI